MEVMVTMAVISAIAAGSYFVVLQVTQDSETVKLRADARTINNAIIIYESNGGNLTGITNPEGVLAKLKSRAVNAKEIAGLRGKMIDLRLTFEISAPDDKGPFCVYDPAAKRFLVDEAATAGIKRFILSESAVPEATGQENRLAVLKLNTSEGVKWIWSFAPSAIPLETDPIVRPAVALNPSGPSGPVPAKLPPPVFYPPPPQNSLLSFPLSVTIGPPSSDQWDTIWSPDNGTFTNYSTPVIVHPGDTLVAKRLSLQKESFLDSDPVTATYTPIPVVPQLTDNFSTTVTYLQLGGDLLFGADPSEVLDPASITLTNTAEIPPAYLNSSVFRMYWTYDGSSPTDSSTRFTGGNFSNGYTGDIVPLSISAFGNSNGVAISYFLDSSDTHIINDSTIMTRAIEIEKIPLQPPLMNPEAGIVIQDATVSLALNSTTGVIPNGARIYYRTDGADPGDSNGDPLLSDSVLWGGTPFVVTPTNTQPVTVVARVYPPSGAKNWFTTSQAVSATWSYAPVAAPPSFNPVPPVPALASYPVALSLTNPNDPSYTEISYHLSSTPSVEIIYTGTTSVQPGVSVTAYVKSKDLLKFRDSNVVDNTYTPNPLQLLLTDTLPASYNYVELGGPLEAGSPATTPVTSGKIVLSDESLVPNVFESSDNFRVHWTLDGSDPFTSGTRYTGATFANGYPGDAVPISLATFDVGGGVTVKYGAEITGAFPYFTNSPLEAKPVTISKITLPEPLITPASGGNPSFGVTLSLNLASGLIPSGARIYYRTDDIDPGDSSGEPGAGATLWTGTPILLTGTQTIKSRVYPPPTYKQWFNTSPPNSATYTQPVYEDAFASDGTSKIYRFDPATGDTAIVTFGGLFNIAAIAFDPVTKCVFYAEDGATNFRLAKYSLTSGAHTLLGSLTTPAAGVWDYTPTQRITNLTYLSGKLWYVHSGSDDLVCITLSGNIISNQSKFADVSNGSKSFGIVGDISTTSDGRLWVAGEDELATFSLTNLNAYTSQRTFVPPALSTPYYPSLLRHGADELYSNRHADSMIRSLGTTGVEGSSVATSPGVTPNDMAATEGGFALPSVTTPFYAITGGNNKIYQLNPLNGQHILLDSSAPFNIGAIAYDGANSMLYYLEDAASTTWRVGKFDVASKTHLGILGDIKTTGTDLPTAHPSNLVFYNKALFYIHPFSQNLVKIPLTVTTDSLFDQFNKPLFTTFQSVGDLALSDSGQLYFVNSNGANHRLFRYDLRNDTGLVELGSTGAGVPSLGFHSNTLYGNGGSGVAIHSLDTSSGNATHVAHTQPNLSFLDFAAGSTAPDPPPVQSYYAICPSDDRLYRLDPSNGDWVQISGTTGFDLAAVAWDSINNVVYYLEEAGSDWRIGKYVPATDTYTTLTGNLGNAASGWLVPATQPKHLVFYGGQLLFIENGTDQLRRIEIDGTSIRGVSLYANINGGASLGNVNAAALAPNGTLYFASSTLVAKYNIATRADYTVISASPSRSWQAFVYANNNRLYGIDDTFYYVTRTVSVTTGNSTFESFTSFLKPFTDIAGATPLSIPDPLGDGELLAAEAGANSILRVNSDTGAFVPLTAATLFQPYGVAYDALSNSVYYTGGSVAGEFRLARYSVSNGQHTELGNLRAASTFAYTPADRAENLIYFQDGLYYVASGTDDLVKIVISGNVIVSQGKVRDLTANAISWSSIGGLASTSLGKAYMGSATTDFFGTFTLPSGTGFTELGAGTSRKYDGLVIRSSDQAPYATKPAGEVGDLGKKYHAFSPSTGALTFTADSQTSSAIIDLSDAVNTPPTLPTLYAVSGDSTTIFKFDPANGNQISWVTDAPFDIECVAVTPDESRVYYVEKATSGWQLGEYSTITSVHTNRGVLAGPSVGYDAPSQPTNLMFQNGRLYYIAQGTDDLVAVEFSTTGAVQKIYKAAELNGDSSLGIIGDIAVDAAGTLYVSTDNAFATWSFQTQSGYTVKTAAPATYWQGLLVSGTNLYGVNNSEPGKLYQINPSTGAGTYVADFSPAANYVDFAAPQPNVQINPAGQTYFITNAVPEIHRIDLANGRQFDVTTQVPLNPTGIALDRAVGIIFTVGYSFSGSDVVLAKYDLATGTHTTLGILNAGTLSYQPNVAPNNLTYFNGHIYYMANATDDLVKITLTGNSVSGQSKIWDVGVPAYDWETLTIGPDSTAYISTRDTDYLARINIAQLAGPIVIKNSKGTDEGADYAALAFSASGSMHGTFAHALLKGYQVNPLNGATSYRWDATYYGAPGLAIHDMTSPFSDAPIGVGEQFATDGTANIYRVNPFTGAVSALTTSGLFNMSALAYDALNNVIFYTENVSTNWRLARYDVGSDTHALISSLDEPTVINQWHYNPTARPTSLSFFDGKLYYLHQSTDDLIRIDIDATGVTNQVKVADITNGVKDFGVVGDITTASTGILWIAAENEVATFDLTTLSNYTQKRVTPSAEAGGQAYYPGLQRNLWDGIHADRQGSNTSIYTLNAAGNEISDVATTPPTQLVDYAGAEICPPLPQVSENFFAVNGSSNIYMLDPLTAQNRILNRSAPFNIGAAAFDAATHYLYYLEEASSPTWRIGRYDVATGTHLAGGAGDLKLIGTNKPTAYPGNLVYYSNALYYIHPTSSNLVKVSLSAAQDAVIDQTNINLGTTFQTIGDLALDDTGMLYWINTNGSTHTLYSYNLRVSSNLSAGLPAARAYPALGFFGGILYGTGGNGSVLDSLNVATGVDTFVAHAQPNQTFTDFAAGSAALPPVTAFFYAVDGTSNLYRLDPVSGLNITIDSAAPYNLGALAYDGTRGYLFYLQDTDLAGATWNLGRYDLASKTHTAVGDIKTSTSAYAPTAVPKNLTYYNGALYFVVPGHDDLIKVQLSAAGNSITSITRAAMMAGGALSFAAPGDIAADNAGWLHFTNDAGAGANTLYRYNLIGGGGLATVGPLAKSQQAVGFHLNNLHAASSTGAGKVNQLSLLTASEIGEVATLPSLVFTDFAGPAADTPPAPSDAFWAITRFSSTFNADVNPRLVRFGNYKNTGGNVERTDFGGIGYQDGSVVTLFSSATSKLEAMVVDTTNRLFFVNNAATIIAGVTYERPLFSLPLGALSGSGPVVGSLVGDLGDGIRTATGISPLTTNETVNGLAVGSDGKIKLAVRVGTGATPDILLSLASLIPNGSGQFTLTTIGTLQNGGVSAGNVLGLAIDSTGQAYVSDGDDGGVWKVSATTGQLTTPMHSTESSAGPIAVHLSDADIITALSDRTVRKILAGDANDTAYFNPLNLWGYNSATAIAFPGLSLTPPPTVTGYFAADGTRSLYRIDPISGANIVVTTAPFAVQSLAFDQASNRLYYVEAAADNWRLGRYDVTSDNHSVYNFNLKVPGGVNQTPITAQPQNLFISNGGIYTILPHTDDLVKIDVSVVGIESIHKVADISGDVSLGAVNAASIDTDGLLYFASTSVLARFDMRLLGDYTVLATNPNIPWSSLVFNSAGNLYGVRSDDPYKTFSVNITNGNPTFSAPVLPQVAFTDIGFSSGPYLPSSGYAFASSLSSPSIHRVDLPTARTYVMSWQAKANVEAVAFDSSNALVYYVDTGDSPTRIHAYDLRTDTHVTLRDAAFQTDLKQIGTNPPTGNHSHNLTHFNGSLYYIATGTDDLYKITLTSPLVIADQVKVADIAGNVAVGNVVGSFTVDDTGMAYVSWEDVDVLARFNMRTLGGYTVIDSTALRPRYLGLTYDGSNLIGIPWDASDSEKLYNVAVASGVKTLINNVNPSQQLLDLATATPNQPGLPAPTANFFAITGENTNIYRFDPTTGQNGLLNNTASYNIGAIAFDVATGNIYYLEDSGGATWRLGKYNISTNTHFPNLGDLKSIPAAPAAYPGNLVYYAGALYYIAPGSSSLTKVQLNLAMSAVTSQSNFDLGTTFSNVGDLTLDNGGILYWVDTNGAVKTMYKYNLRDGTAFAAVGTTTNSYPALGVHVNVLYGTGGNAFVVDSLSTSTASASIASTVQPNRLFTDFASGSTAAVPAPPVWSIGENGKAQLLKINGYDGVATLVNYGDIRYNGAGGTLTAWSADSDIEAFAVTSDGFAYFVCNKDTIINDIVYGRPLFRIDLNTVSIGTVNATFIGDLDQALSAMKGSAIVTSSNVDGVSALTVGMDGALYGVYQVGSSIEVDKLFKITGLSMDGGENLLGYSFLGNITSGSNVGTQVDALEFSASGTLYGFDSQDGEMLVIDPTNGAVTSLHSTESANVIKDIAISPINDDFIASNFSGKNITRVVAIGADTAFFSYQNAPPWLSPTFSDLPGLKFPVRSFSPAPSPPSNIVYACTGGNRDIYTVNLTTGATAKVVDSGAAFNVSSLAYDPLQNTVFYIQDAATNYSLGSWQIGTNTHTIIYNMTSGNDFNSLNRPTNLTWWGGYLWYIEPHSDNLIRITSSPMVATQQIKVRDLTTNAVSYTQIGDLAVSDAGMLYYSAIAAGNSVFAKFDMTTMSGYTKILELPGTSEFCQSLVFGPQTPGGRILYAARDSTRTIIRSINTTTGIISSTATGTTPSLAMFDTSDRHLNVAPSAGTYYAVVGETDRKIYTVNPETGATSQLTTAPASFAGLAAIAFDQLSGYLYYIEEAASSFKLGRYSLDTDTHVNLGSLQGSYAYSPSSKPTNLAFIRGGLYYIATGSDDLVRVDVGSTSILDQLKMADLNGNVSYGSVGDLVAGANWDAYFTAGGKLYSFNVLSLAAAAEVFTFSYGTPDALAIRNDGALLYGAFNPAAGGALTNQIYKITTGGAVGTNVSTGALSFTDLAGPDLSRADPINRIFIGGDFQQDATGYRGIARLLSDTGLLDPSFNSGSGPNAGSEVKTILPVSNGQVLGGGNFGTFHGQPRTGVVRLNPDGSVDQTFVPVFK